MINGETIRLQCNDCSIEYEVTREPKMKGSPNAERGLEEPTYCPWCGNCEAVEEV